LELFDLTGKVAIITGGSRGIGKAIATRMAQHGASVVVSSRKLEVCEAVASEIVAGGGKAIAVACNISHKDQLQNLVDKTREAFGKIDILVCNASVSPYFGSSATINDEQFDKIINTNIRSNHWLAHMVLPEMVERKDGSIIIISSIAGLAGSSLFGTYAISKAADLQLARNLAVEYGGDNVRINCISPGFVKTDYTKVLWDNPEFLASMLKTVPLKRIGMPDEIAGAAIYLAARSGSYTNGQNIIVDGGVTIS